METFIEISGFPGYEVSNKGTIRSIPRTVLRGGHSMHLSGKTFSPGIGTKGHQYVNLRHQGKYFTRYVHRLVAFHFIGPPSEGQNEIAHWDGDPSNNDARNLRWASPSENHQDMIRHGRSKRPGGREHAKAKLSDEDLLTMFSMHNQGCSGRSVSRYLGISHHSVNNILRGRAYKKDLDRLGLTPI